MLPSGQQILFTRQLHEAKKAGRHYDVRFVVGDKAYSFATKKELPEPGKAILLYEQPVHTAHYALSERVEIPDGQYGAGITTLVDAFKARVGEHSTPTQMTIESKEARYLLKKVDDEKYGKTAWLFKNLSSGNKYLDKAAAIDPELLAKFTPDLTPAQMKSLGVLEGKYTTGTPDKNFFRVDASMKEWPDKWHNDQHPMGWFEWYENYHDGKRTDDDERQIKRWLSFKARHLAQLKTADPTLQDLTIQPRRRQALLNWGIAPGIETNKYLEKVAVRIHQYEHKDTKAKKWVAEGKTVPHGYLKTDKSFYKRKGSGMSKSAGELQPHQNHALDKLEKEDGVLVHHSTGSGKTKTFLTAVERAQQKDKTKKALIVAPASLVSNVDKEIEKHKLKIDRKRLVVLSYDKATRDVENLAKDKYSLIAFDEGHKLRNTDTKRTQALGELASKADKRLVATATANYNHLADISPLLNIVAGGKVLPTDRKEVENRYLKKVITKPSLVARILGAENEEHHELNGRKELGEVFKKYVSYYDAKKDPDAAKKFPKVTEEVIETPMSKPQTTMYKYVEGGLPFLIRMKIRNNLPLDKKEKASLNSFATGVRQVSNTTRHLSEDQDRPDYTPKVKTAVSRLEKRMKEDKNFRGVVYSNFLEAGVNEYARLLKEKKIPHNVYTGALSKTEKDQMVKDYNEGKSPVLLITSSGSEGLDLKGTKLTQVLEPHFNKSKIKQVMGRGARYESHEHLPEEERNMHVEHYLSTYEKPFLGKAPYSIDKYLSENSDDKDVLFEQVRNLMDKSK